MSKSLYTEIVINAPKEKVWEILMDFENYHEWNPFIHELRGIKAKGGKLYVSMQQPEGKIYRFTPRVTVYKVNEEFCWLGKMLIPGIFDGEHKFKLKAVDEQTTKFSQSENFKGLLVKSLWKDLSTKTLKGFEMMNAALKKRVENPPPQP